MQMCKEKLELHTSWVNRTQINIKAAVNTQCKLPVGGNTIWSTQEAWQSSAPRQTIRNRYEFHWQIASLRKT